ncbi:MAG TPA: nucleotidyltransferase domain-containing protein [bacterium]|nr:nucleotidyltransferase domain-containing protein [bacterium]
MVDISEFREKVAPVCQELGVERLDVFGSITRPDFHAESDMDIVARLDRRPGKMFTRYFTLKERLERIFGRSVVLVLEDSIRNPHFRDAVENSRVSLYMNHGTKKLLFDIQQVAGN